MITTYTLVAVSLIGHFPAGYEFDCKSWTGVRTKLMITLVAKDGSENVGRLEITAGAAPLDAQIGLVAALEGDDWVVRSGPNHTVIVFGPKGQSVASIQFKSDGWVPNYKRVFGPPTWLEKPKK